MSASAFLDTNIFVYANAHGEPRKRDIALELIRTLAVSGDGAISYQVMHEFFNVAFKKASRKMTSSEASLLLDDVFRPLQVVPPSFALVSDAIRLQERFRLSWYDSLIVSAAQRAGCHTLYSEDLQHGQQFGPLTVKDPFR